MSHQGGVLSDVLSHPLQDGHLANLFVHVCPKAVKAWDKGNSLHHCDCSLAPR